VRQNVYPTKNAFKRGKNHLEKIKYHSANIAHICNIQMFIGIEMFYPVFISWNFKFK